MLKLYAQNWKLCIRSRIVQSTHCITYSLLAHPCILTKSNTEPTVVTAESSYGYIEMQKAGMRTWQSDKKKPRKTGNSNKHSKAELQFCAEWKNSSKNTYGHLTSQQCVNFALQERLWNNLWWAHLYLIAVNFVTGKQIWFLDLKVIVGNPFSQSCMSIWNLALRCLFEFLILCLVQTH